MKLHMLCESVSNNSFKAVVVLALPGSGKSTLIQKAIKSLPSDVVYVNPDVPVERGDLVGDELEQRKYSNAEIEDKVTNAILSTSPMIIETTPSNERRLVARIVNLQRLGYDVSAIVLDSGISDEETIERIRSRGREVDSTIAYYKEARANAARAAATLQSNVHTVKVTPGDFASTMSSLFSAPLQNEKGKEIKNIMQDRNLDSQYPEIMSEREYQYLNNFWYTKSDFRKTK